MIDKDSITIIAQATALPGNEKLLRTALEEVIPPSLAEAGIQTFRLHEDIERPGHFVFYEQFANQAALDSHFRSSHFKKVVETVGPLVGGGPPNIMKLRQISE